MCSKVFSLVLLIGLCASIIGADHINSKVASQHSLLNFMMRTRDISNQYPQRSMDCFTYYVPILNEITAEYEKSYALCLRKSDEAKISVDESTQADRDCIESSAKDACQLLSACNEHKSSIDYFECYVNGGSVNSKTMYGISTNASEILVNIREQYRLIDNEQYRCTNASERAYVENTAATYEQLHNCIEGKSPVPTEPSVPTTTTTPVPETTTGESVTITTPQENEAESLFAKDSLYYNIVEGIKKFERPSKLH